MINAIKTSIAKGVLGKLADDHDTKTTALGIAAAALLAGNIDYGKLFAGDGQEIGKAIGAVIAAGIGYYTNKPNGPRA